MPLLYCSDARGSCFLPKCTLPTQNKGKVTSEHPTAERLTALRPELGPEKQEIGELILDSPSSDRQKHNFKSVFVTFDSNMKIVQTWKGTGIEIYLHLSAEL